MTRAAAKAARQRGLGGALLLAAALFCSGVLQVDASRAVGPSAISARSVSLNERGRLHLTSKRGFMLNEEGSASGAIKGKIYLHLKVVSTNRVTAEVSIYPTGGSLTGNVTASYHVAGAVAAFSGTMSIVRGTGSYRRAHGSGLGFSGTISRSNDAVTVHPIGTMLV
jgi:hypothetical protein